MSTIRTLKLHVIFQTHWDREWYFPYETFRHRLTLVLDRVMTALEKGELQQFVLDGQMAALEDYLEVCEAEDWERLLRLIENKQIVIGPWYVLADEFLVSGESLYRNLEHGLKKAHQYDTPQMVGYLPDTFGHVSQMPQLLRKFGIDNAVLWRGLKAPRSEVLWEGSDGSTVFTVFLPEGYYQQLADLSETNDGLTSYVNKVKAYAGTDHLLLTNGGDHLMPQHGDIVQNLLKDETDFEVVMSNLEDYISLVKQKNKQDLFHVKGELRSNEHIYILPNVLSTRSYLKEQNQRLEDDLTGWTEPLLALAAFHGHRYPKRFMEHSWKLLLKNHPHDSICGCSVDEVHREMETRSMKLSQQLDAIKSEAFEALGIRELRVSGSGEVKPFEDDVSFTVFNPRPYSYTGWVKGKLFLKNHFESFMLKGNDGKEIIPAILNHYEGERFESPLDAFPDFVKGTFYEVAFPVERLNGLSVTTFTVERKELEQITESHDHNKIENNYFSVKLEQDATLTIKNKQTGETSRKQHAFYSSLDAGDEYNYSPPVKDTVTFAEIAKAPTVNIANGFQEMMYQLLLNQPASLNKTRDGASSEHVQSIISVKITLFHGDDQLYFKTSIDNKAKDQRLRVRFPLGENLLHTYSDSAFDWVKRDAGRREVFDAPKQKEVPVVVDPSYSCVKAGNLTFLHRGLQEYQTVRHEYEDSLDVTLVRSVGWLSRDDLRTRGGGAGPRLKTPEAQCIRITEFQYAVTLGNLESSGEILHRAKKFRVPPLLQSGKGRCRLAEGLIEINNPLIQWSACRVHENKLELRLWNPEEKEQTFTVLCNGLSRACSLKPKEIDSYTFDLN